MIEWLITSSILIAVVIAIRYILRGKLSLRLQYALWALVLVRLLIPVSFGSTSFSAMSVVEKTAIYNSAEQYLNKAEEPAIAVDNSEMNDKAGEYAENPALNEVSEQSSNEGLLQHLYGDTYVNLLSKTLTIIWLTVASAFIIFFVITNLRFSIRIKKKCSSIKVAGSALPVYMTDAVETPCLFGLFQPEIFVTAEAAENKTILRHAVEHEMSHYRHGDHVWSILRVICLALHWYNPLVWWAAFLSRRDAELACDEATIKRLGEHERAGYGRTLIGMTCEKRTELLVAATTMNGSKAGISERILLIAKKPEMAGYTLIAVVILAVAAVGCTFTGAVPEEAGKPVFSEREDVKSMSLHGQGEGTVNVAEEYLPEMMDWLHSFKLGEEVKGEEPKPGTNSFSVTITYSDGSSETSGLDIALAEGKDYYIERPELPQCWYAAWRNGKETEISMDVDGKIPSAVIDYAKEYVALRISDYKEMGKNPAEGAGSYTITDARITGLKPMNTGTAGLNSGVAMYLLEYRLLPDKVENVMLAGGMTIENGWITESGSTGQPYLLLYYDGSGSETIWQRICVTNTNLIEVDYGTPEMLERYGNAYTAAAMELYKKFMPAEEVVSLTQEQIEKANAALVPLIPNSEGVLEVNPVCCFFTSWYNKPEDLNFADFLRYLPGSDLMTDKKEFRALKKLDGWRFGQDVTLENMPVPTRKYLSEAVDQVLWEYAGISLAALSGVGFDEVLYLEEYDAYYNFTSDFGPGIFQCTRGEIAGNIVRLYWDKDDGGIVLLTLRNWEGKYYIISHQLLKAPG
ncbi:MAG: hypothetical protein KBA53_04430 [Thermoclostridium sp.]|nr:hypothetical protein [Thermoclostridium sp.]